jgi:hypothetical protein
MNPEAQVFIKHVILVMSLFLAPIFPPPFPFCYLIVCCLLLGSTQGKRSFSSSKKTRRWFAEAFGFALHKRYLLDHPVYI